MLEGEAECAELDAHAAAGGASGALGLAAAERNGGLDARWPCGGGEGGNVRGAGIAVHAPSGDAAASRVWPLTPTTGV